MQKLAFVFLFAMYAPFAWCQTGCNTPSGTFSYQIDDMAVTFSNSVINATTWKWDFGDGNTSTAKDPNHNYRAYGNFNVCVTGFSACTSAFFCHTVTLTPLVTAVEEIPESTVRVFPNPINSQLLVSFNGLLPQRITIINSSGNIMSLYSAEEIRASMSLDISMYPVGAYILTWATAGRIQSRRIVKVN